MLDGRAYTTLSKRYSKVTRREWVVEAASDDPSMSKRQKHGTDPQAMPFDDICKDLSSKPSYKGFRGCLGDRLGPKYRQSDRANQDQGD